MTKVPKMDVFFSLPAEKCGEETEAIHMWLADVSWMIW